MALPLFRRKKTKVSEVTLSLRGGPNNIDSVRFILTITNGIKAKGGGVEATLTIDQAVEIAAGINKGIVGLSNIGRRR